MRGVEEISAAASSNDGQTRKKDADKTAPGVPIRHGAPGAPARHLLPGTGADRCRCPNRLPRLGSRPGVTPPRGWARSPAGSVRSPPVHLEKVWSRKHHTHREKQNNTRRRKPKQPAAQRPRKMIRGPSALKGTSSERIPKNARGQKNTPDKPQEQEGRAAKRAGPKRKTAAQGAEKTKKKQDQKRAGGGVRVTCYYLIFLS